METVRLYLLASLLVTAGLAGCTNTAPTDDGVEGDPADDRAATATMEPEPRELPTARFVATDYAIAGPATIAGGPTRITLVNEGEEWHVLDFARIGDGHTYEEALEQLLAEGGEDENATEPEWIEFAGVTGVVGNGRTGDTVLDLAPGTYLVICWIGDAEGVPHFHHGMVTKLVVTAPGPGPVDLPDPTLTLSMDEFSFAWDATPTAGDHVVRVVNDGDQGHEAVLVLLDEGANMTAFNDALAAMFFIPNATKPDHIPGQPVGGAIDLEPGEERLLFVTFEAGRTYGLVCFFEDEDSGASHHELGMVAEFVVA